MNQDRTTSRRSLLGTAAGATGAALAAAVWKPTQAAAALPQEMAAAADPSAERSYTSGNFFLTLDGSKVGFIKAIDGGYITADVIDHTQGTGAFSKKQIGSPIYEEFSLQLGFAMNKPIYDWIAASWKMNYARHDGSIIAADFEYVARSAREFKGALLTETTIPACDGSVNAPGYLTVNFKPDFITYVPGSGEKITFDQGNQQKLWLPSNFRLEIDGVDCTRVSKIDAFTVKQGVVTDSVGDARVIQMKPAAPVFPNVKVTLSQISLASWMDWFQSFVVQGNNSDGQEKNGRLQLLTPDLGTALAEIKFFNMGIFKLEQESTAADANAIVRWAAELYCERMEFTYLPAVT
jgi:hypothetical protein